MYQELTLADPSQTLSDLKLPAKLRLELSQGRRMAKLSLLDSFDQRITSKDKLLLWISGQGKAGTLQVRDAKTHDTQVELQLKARPERATDVPPHFLAGKMADWLGQRALLPTTEHATHLTSYALYEGRRCIADVLLVEIDGSTDATLLVDARRGYDAEVKKALKSIPAAERMDSFLDGLAKDAQNWTKKGFPTLKPQQSAISAVRALHMALLEQMQAQVEGTKQDLDIEFLHELRVACRRARSLLQTVKSVLSPADQAYGSENYRWIGQQTTHMRDMDVYLDDYPKLEDSLSADLAEALLPFKKKLQQERAKAFRSVKRTLNSKGFANFCDEWAARLDADAAVHGPKADAPIFEVASKTILKRYGKICAAGALIGDETPAEALHDLRKDGKKLRYLLEFFASLYPPEIIKPRIATLKKLQDLLGAYQDCSVQANFLENQAGELINQGDVPAETLMAMGALADARLREEVRLRGEFRAFFKPFSSKAEQDAYARMTAHPTKSKKSTGKKT